MNASINPEVAGIFGLTRDMHYAFQSLGQLNNVMFSPYNVAQTLLLLMMAGAGRTRKEIMWALYTRENETRLVEQFLQDIREHLEYINSNGEDRLTSKTVLLIQRGFTIGKDFNEELKRNDIEFKHIDLRDQSKVYKIIDQYSKATSFVGLPRIPRDSKFALVQSFNFEIKWSRPWQEHDYRIKFYGPRTTWLEVLVHEDPVRYKIFQRNTSSVHVFEVPFAQKELSMFFFLPNNTDLMDMLVKFPPAALASNMIKEKEPERMMRLFVPKFSHQRLTVLDKSFIKDGIVQAFSTESDFSIMSAGTTLFGGCYHSTSFTFASESVYGGEAMVAPLAGSMADFSHLPSRKIPAIFFNRPFAYIIMYSDQQANKHFPLFAGTVIVPLPP